MGQCEDDVEVSCGKQFPGTLKQPSDFGKVLTLGAVTIPAGVEAQALIATLVLTGFQVTSQGGRSATDDVADDFSLLVGDGTHLQVVVGMRAEYVGQFRGVRCGRRQPFMRTYFFGLHELPPLVSGFWRASQGLSMVPRYALLTCV